MSKISPGATMLGVAVDFFWRRVRAAEVRDLDAQGLRVLMPYWFDERFKQEREASVVLGVEDPGELMHVLFTLGAGDGPDAEAAAIPVGGAPGLDDDMIGVLAPEKVQAAATFLTTAPIGEWVKQYGDDLAIQVRQWGFRRRFDDEWANTLIGDAQALTGLFQRAAAAQESVIVAVVA